MRIDRFPSRLGIRCAARSGLAIVRPAQLRDVDRLHLHHRLHGSLAPGDCAASNSSSIASGTTCHDTP
jgi:hypothetical protein